MSIEAIKWAVEQAPPMPAQLVATLVGLANHADAKGRGAYPSLPTLAAYTCKSDRSVRRDLRDLETLGLIRPGDPARTAHLPSDKRPEVYDLALELTVPDGRAGKSEGTRASARTLASSRARGGKKKTSSDEMRADVDVRGDADVRADVDVTSGGTPTSQRADVGVRQTVLEPSVEPLSPRVPQPTAPEPPAAPSTERETNAARNKPTAAQRSIRTHTDITEAEEPAFIAWIADKYQPRSPGWWRTAASDLPELADTWRAQQNPNQAQQPAGPPLPRWCGHCGDEDPAAAHNARLRYVDTATGPKPCKACHPDAMPAAA